MADKKGISLTSTPAPYVPPHLRTGSHLPTSEETSDLQHQCPRSMYHRREDVTDPSQGAPWILDHPQRPKFSMTCFDAGDAVVPPSCIEAIRLQVLPSCQEKWSPHDYLRGDQLQALCFYLSRAPMTTAGQTSGPSSELMESSALSPSAASSSRESQNCGEGHMSFAGDWRRSTYEEILSQGLLELADNNSTARCLSCTQDARQLPVRERVKERVKVSTKVEKCFFRASVTAFQKALQFQSLLDNVELANLASVELQARKFSISELGELITSRQLTHQSVSRVMSARNIINGRNYLLKSSMHEDIPQRCKIVIMCGDRENPGNEYDITIVYKTDATATFPEREPDLQGKSSQHSSCNEADCLTQNQKLYPTWREAANARLLSIIVKRSPKRHCFVNFLRQRKASDIRLGVEKREVPQTEPCESKLRAWVQQAWDMRSERGVLQFQRVKRFRLRVVRYMDFMETFKSKDFKVKMCKVTEFRQWRETSTWECLLQSLQVKEMCKKGFKPDDVAMMVPLVHELVQETANLTLAMGDVNFVH